MSRLRFAAAAAAITGLLSVLVVFAVLTSDPDSPAPLGEVPNLVANPSFESGARDWTSCGGVVQAVSDPKSPSGDHVAEVKRSGPGCGGITLNQAAPALNGSTIRGQSLIASASVRGTGASVGERVMLILRERDADGNLVGQASSLPIRLESDYQRIQRSYVTAKSGDDLEIYLATNSGGPFRADDMTLSVLDDIDACPAPVANFGVDAWPPACWRPYSDSSVFNTPLRDSDAISPESSRVVDQLLSEGDDDAPDSLPVGDPSSGANIPIYFGQKSDPVFTLRCLGHDAEGASAPCGGDIDGSEIHIPAEATPAGDSSVGSDRHLTVVEPDGIEYDFYDVTDKDDDAGTMTFAGGGAGPVDGGGTGFGAVAALTGAIGGLIRGPELSSGVINHALQMYVPCVSGDPVPPAAGDGLQCGKAVQDPKRYPGLRGVDACSAPPMGAHFRLDISNAKLSRLQIPEYQRAIARALAHYGAYVVDTSGNRNSWGFRVEGAGTYVDFGRPDPAAELAAETPQAQRVGSPSTGNSFIMPLDSGIEWRRLRLLDVGSKGSRPC